MPTSSASSSSLDFQRDFAHHQIHMSLHREPLVIATSSFSTPEPAGSESCYFLSDCSFIIFDGFIRQFISKMAPTAVVVLMPEKTFIMVNMVIHPWQSANLPVPFMYHHYSSASSANSFRVSVCKTSHSQLVDQKFNSFSAKGFSEDVRQLILRSDKIKFDHPFLNMLLDKVKSNIDMLQPGMLNIVAA
ncbi:hypothetical protein Tco_1427797 [Tanacetum coccineum]